MTSPRIHFPSALLLAILVAMPGIFGAVAVAGEVEFQQPKQRLYIDDPTLVMNDGDYRDRFEDKWTSVCEARIGDSQKNHIWKERELNLSSGNPDYCFTGTPDLTPV